jgi:hypothetical protein
MARGKNEDATSANGRADRLDLDAIEREHVEQLARAHAALAAAQDRSYWLDRWGIDLNALMRRPGARRVRAALRALRELQRGTIAVQRYAKTRIDDLRRAAAEDDLAAASQNARGADARASTAGEPSASRA